GATQEYIGIFCLDSPGSHRLWGFCEGKAQGAVENIASIVTEFLLDIDRALGFEARLAVIADSQAILDWFSEPLIKSVEAAAHRAFPHRGMIGSKQPPGRIQREERQCVKTPRAEIWSEDAVVR